MPYIPYTEEEKHGLDRISPHEGREIRESWARIQADLL